MLNALRKYQKIIFGFVAVLVIVPFAFSGIFSRTSFKDSKRFFLGKALDGSKVYQDEIDRFVAFLSLDSQESLVQEQAARQNYFNDGVLKKDIFETGIGEVLLENYQQELKGELEEKFSAFQNYRAYEHPQAHFLNAERVWLQFCPDLLEAIHQFKKTKNLQDQFRIVKQIYLSQREFPPALLRQFLYFQEKQLNLSYQDPYIQRGDLAVFHAKNPYDFFGYQFLNLCAQFIHNAAIAAKSKGFHVSKEEAKANLMDNIYQVLKSQSKSEKDLVKLVQKTYYETLAHFKFTESEMIQIWQKVLLFRRLLTDVSKTALVDGLTYDQFAKFAFEKADLQIYQAPKELAFDSFQNMMQFEIYAQCILDKKFDSLELPTQLKSLSNLQKSYPQLFYKTFKLKILEIDREEFKKNVSMKQILSYLTEEKNFKQFCLKQPKLNWQATVEERLKAFEKLEEVEKAPLISMAQKLILQNDTHLEAAAMARDYEKEIDVKIPLSGPSSVFKGFDQNEKIIQILEADTMPCILDNQGRYVYKVAVVEKNQTALPLTFKEAVDQGVLKEMLLKKLEPFYQKVQSKHAELFHDQQGYIALDQVIDLVGELYFKDLIEKLRNELTLRHLLAEGDVSLDHLARKRFVLALEETLKKKQREFKVEPEEHPLASQFHLAVLDTLYEKKNTRFPGLEKQVFRMKTDEWSSLVEDQFGQLAFFQVKEKKVDGNKKTQLQLESQTMLSYDAVRFLAYELINDFQVHQAIHLQSFSEVE